MRAIVVAAAMLAVVLFYFWTVKTARGQLGLRGQETDYYNLLVDGFQEGHLYMKATPHPDLLALPPEQRPGTAPFLLDASLYEGRYYLYFGVVPVVTLYWPCAALTGRDMPEALAALIFAAVAFGFSVWWWLDVRRHFFPTLGIGWDVVCILALGFCTVLPSTLRRPMFYEVAIVAGWAFGVIALWALTRAWRSSRRQKAWLLLAGVAVGLAVGSRPNLAPAGLLALVAGCAVVAWQPGEQTTRRWRRLLALLCWAAAGSGIIGAGLAGYNYARFGSVVEFGHSYQIGLNPVQYFRGSNFWHNLRLYYFAPPQVGAYFPYLTPAEEPPKPVDYVGRESAHGEWVWSVVLLAAGVLLFRAALKRRPGLRQIVSLTMPVAVWFAVNLLVTGLTGVRSNRYMVDFHPAAVLGTLAVLGVVLHARGWPDRLARGLMMFGLVTACLFNALASMQVHDWFASTAPGSFQRLARIADGSLWRVAPGIFSGVGDREVEVRWPGWGVVEASPLVSAGPGGFDDGIWIHPDGAGRARFIFQHWDFAETTGPWFAIDPGQPARLRISGAFLLPPAGHPWYGARPDHARAALKRRLRLAVDGQIRFDRDVPSHNSAPWQLRWGEWRVGGSGSTRRYNGTLGRPRPLSVDDTWLAETTDRRGTVRLRVTLPTNHFGLAEPLVQTGVQPAWDMVMVRLTRPGFVQLIHDNKGAGAHEGTEFAVDYEQWQTIEIELPNDEDGASWNEQEVPLTSRLKYLRVRWNGRETLVSPLPFHATRPPDLVIGANLVGDSICRPMYAGEIEVAPFLAPFAPVRSGTLAATFDADDVLVGTQGVLIGWQRPDLPAGGTGWSRGGLEAALVWRRADPAAPAYLGWLNGGRITWGTQPLAGGLAPLRIDLPRDPASTAALGAADPDRGLVEVEQGERRVLSALTNYFREGAAPGWSPRGRAWTGFEHRSAETQASPGDRLPGRIVIRFALPAGGFTGSDPLLCAGVAGAADGLYLRAVGDGRYILGLDHWGFGTVESAPLAVEPGAVHRLVIELGSLFPPGEAPGDLVRLRLNDAIALETRFRLHPVKAGQVVAGRNPLGMSTSGPLFRGEIYSVRTNQPAVK